MKTKWTNYGDINHRTEGGIFISVGEENGLTQEIDAVKIEPTEWDGKEVTSYTMEVASYSWQELREEFQNRYPNSMYEMYDWKRYEGQPFENIVGFLSADMINHHGGQSSPDTGRNYWELLSQEGIRRSNII